ncbi:UDP-N-acetylglucosamine 2-epimerase [Candidatus Omnitrophota bacterium]
MDKRKIVVITGARADYGRLKSVLDAIKKHPQLELSLVVTGMHLLPELGDTQQYIEEDGFEIDARVPMYFGKEDTGGAMAKSLARCVEGMVNALEDIRPDMCLASVDRVETLASVIPALFMNIPIAHIQGGEVTGTVDESIRHAVTKMSHIHFPSNQDAAERIIKMGEDPRYVFMSGCPNVDIIHSLKYDPKEKFIKEFKLDASKPLALFIQHPVTTEADESTYNFMNTLTAIRKFDLETIMICPNIDAGGKRIIDEINAQKIKYYPSLPFRKYLNLMAVADFMIGNSSSGIREAPSFNLPAVNVGTRQQGRLKAGNVIDVGYSIEEIARGIDKALYDKEFKKQLADCKNPYDPFGDGKSGERIVNILATIDLKSLSVQKRITY